MGVFLLVTVSLNVELISQTWGLRVAEKGLGVNMFCGSLKNRLPLSFPSFRIYIY